MSEDGKKFKKISDLFWENEDELIDAYLFNPVARKMIDILYELYK